MNAPNHFEDLWQQCETFHQEASASASLSQAMDSLILKVKLYQTLCQQEDQTSEEMQKVKSRTLGEILLSLTCLSLKDNINVFEALAMSLQLRSTDFYADKYPQ